MAVRGNGRRRQMPKPDTSYLSEEVSTHHASKTSGKKTTSSSSTSKSLNEILDILKISYDKENGLLTGDLSLPPLTSLEALLKNLTKLSDQLEIISNLNSMNIAEISRVKKGLEDELHNNVLKQENDISMDDLNVERDQIDARIGENEHEFTIDEKDNQGPGPKEIPDSKYVTDNLTSATEDTKFSQVLKSENPSINTISEGRTTENDRESKHSLKEFVRNPKSEFVTSQTLPTAAYALGLFTDANTLKSNGEIDLKKKYGVASYPSTDLKDKLPGVIPDIDFSKIKPTNQVQFATFQTFVENFFRNFTDDDLKFLKKNYVDVIVPSNNSNGHLSSNVNPFLMPKLGSLYTKVWNEEEQQEGYSTTIKEPTIDHFTARGSNEKLNDDTLESENISLGPLVSRLLSAMVQENDIYNSASGLGLLENETESEDKKQSTAISLLQQQQQPTKIPSVNVDFNTLEDRLKTELKYIGLYNINPDEDEEGESMGNGNNDSKDFKHEDEPNWVNMEDDEVSQELRQLQGNLKQLVGKNNKRKRVLIPIIENQLSWQEYLSILDDLDKQVDQVYLKRIKVPKNKKKKGPAHQIPPSLQQQINNQQKMANSNIKSVLEKRQKWISKISPLFYKRRKLHSVQSEKSENQGEDYQVSKPDIESEPDYGVQQNNIDILELSDGGYMKKHPMGSVFNTIDYEIIDEDDDDLDDDNIVGKDKDKDDVLDL